MVDVWLDPAWPGLGGAPSERLDADHDRLALLSRRLHEMASEISGASRWIQAGSDACASLLVPHAYLTATVQRHVELHTVAHVTSLYAGLTLNLRAAAERFEAAAHNYRVVEDEHVDALRAVTRLTSSDGWDRHGGASAWTDRPDWSAGRGTDRLRLLPAAQPMRGAIRLGPVGMPATIPPPRAEAVAPWLRELKQTAGWEPRFALADQWRAQAGNLDGICRSLRSLAVDLAPAWSGEPARRAQQALRRIHGTARALEEMSSGLGASTHAVAERLKEADRLRFRLRSGPDPDLVDTVLRIDTSLQEYLYRHPSELSYDLPFTDTDEGSRHRGVQIAWPLRQIPPSPPYQSTGFWGDDEDPGVPPLIG